MQFKGKIQKNQMRIIGIEVRTRNQDEQNRQMAKIPGLWERFARENVASRIPHKAAPGYLLELYTEYESNEHGAYTAFLGFEVTSLEEAPEGMIAKIIPASTYAVFTTERGMLGQVVQDAWREIWSMNEMQLGGKRSFTADFEVFHEGSQNPQDAKLDIYVSLV